MKKTFLVSGPMFIALIATGLVMKSGPVVAQQAEGMEEIVVEAPMESRQVGRSSSTGAKIEEFNLKRRVSYADLDLCMNADVTEVKARIENTAKDLCKELSDKFPLNPSDPAEIGRCTTKAIDGTDEQLKAAIADAQSDSDGDGVANCMDKCRETPANTSVDKSGCTVAVTTPPAEAFELQGVNFNFDSAELTADSMRILDADVELLQRHSDVMVEIAGHTDSQGSDEYNQGLSERRAQAVVDYLVSHGVNAGNVTARGYGESSPIADNDTTEGRASNRRAELRQK